MTRQAILSLAAAAAAFLPIAAQAQSWEGGYRATVDTAPAYAPQAYAPQGYAQYQGGYGVYDRGDEHRRDGGDFGYAQGGYRGRAFRGYPEFTPIKAHIREELISGREEGWLEPDMAWRLTYQLNAVEAREAHEYRVHGWNLPGHDRAGIRDSLGVIDRAVDSARDGD